MSITEQWISDYPPIDTVEEVLRLGRHVQGESLRGHWIADASVQLGANEPDRIAARSRGMINSAPYGAIYDAINEQAHSQDHLLELRRIRKLLLVARDGVIMTFESGPNESYDPLFALCRGLGNLSVGKGTYYDRIYALEACQTLREQKTTHQPNCDIPMFTTRIKDVQKSESTLALLQSDIAPEAYHKHRKAFRRVAHVAVLASVLEYNLRLRNFAASGLKLSQMFGEHKDRLFGEETPVELDGLQVKRA